MGIRASRLHLPKLTISHHCGQGNCRNYYSEPGYINVDFADVETVMKDSGVELWGMGSRIGRRGP